MRVIGDFAKTIDGWTLASGESLSELLKRFETDAVAAGAPVDQLAPGLQLAEIEEAFGFTPHPELVEWFQWHDGYTEDNPQAAGSLPQVIASSARSTVEWGRLPEPNESWMLVTEEAWGPVVDLESPASEPLRVAFASDDFDPDRAAAEGRLVRSLRTMVAWWIAGIGSGGYAWEGNHWVVNADLLPESQREVHFF